MGGSCFGGLRPPYFLVFTAAWCLSSALKGGAVMGLGWRKLGSGGELRWWTSSTLLFAFHRGLVFVACA